MAKIVKAEVRLLNLMPPTKRVDAIQSFNCQETPLVTLTDADGISGTGYSYTIGTGGSSIVALLRDHLLPQLVGLDAERIEANWRTLKRGIHALTVGPIASLALAAVDVAAWDLRCRRAYLPLHLAVGGAHERSPVYTTEAGWLHLSTDELVAGVRHAQRDGFAGAKIKIGKPHLSEDVERLLAVREAVGPGFDLMVDANQGLSLDEAQRRAEAFVDVNLAWIEEPMPADDVGGHRRLAASSPIPVAVGESLYSLSQFKEYLHAGACSVVQVDVARIGGITPWLKVAHLAEAYNLSVSPHFLMELHTPLAAGVANGGWVEYIPQLDTVTRSSVCVRDGHVYPSSSSGIGIDWDWDAIDSQQLSNHRLIVS